MAWLWFKWNAACCPPGIFSWPATNKYQSINGSRCIISWISTGLDGIYLLLPTPEFTSRPSHVPASPHSLRLFPRNAPFICAVHPGAALAYTRGMKYQPASDCRASVGVFPVISLCRLPFIGCQKSFKNLRLTETEFFLFPSRVEK